MTPSDMSKTHPDVFEPPRATFPDGHFKPATPDPIPTSPIDVFEKAAFFQGMDRAPIQPEDVFVDGKLVRSKPVRKFDSGATRDQDTTKFDYEGFMSPLVVERFAGYMHHNRIQSDGSTRDSDNWQKGIPLSSYMKSLWRHLITVWHHHRGITQIGGENIENALCGVIFNTQGYLHEILKAKGE